MGKQSIKDEENAVTPILGAVLMVFLTFVLAGATVAAVYNDGAIERINNAFTKTPTAVIKIEGIVGGVPNPTSYHDIDIKLRHKGGDSLEINSTFIILSGKGLSQMGVFGFPGFKKKKGDTIVKYTNLAYSGKIHNRYIKTNSAALDDDLWSTGEQLILNGDDSNSSNNGSTVQVTVNGILSDSDNYGFDTGTTVTIKIFDKTTQRIIAEGTAIVKSAE